MRLESKSQTRVSISGFTHRSGIVVTFPRPETWRWTKRTVIGCLTCRSNGLMGGPWPINAAIYSRPSAVSLRETKIGVTYVTSEITCSEWLKSNRDQTTDTFSLCYWSCIKTASFAHFSIYLKKKSLYIIQTWQYKKETALQLFNENTR